jgi:hypothetical protein
MNTDEQDNLLNRVAEIFLRCFLLCYALLLLWFAFYFLAGNWAYGIQAGWFELSRHDFSADYVGFWGGDFFHDFQHDLCQQIIITC